MGAGYQRVGAPRLALGTINVIFARPKGDAGACSGVMSVVVGLDLEDGSWAPKKAKVGVTPTLGFLEEDKEGTLQLLDDALVVTIRIGGYDMKMDLVDQGSGVEIMYLDLYKRLNLRPEDLEKYDSLLVGFDGFEQSLSKGPFPHSSDRSIGGCNSWTSSDEFLGRLPRVSSNTSNINRS